MRSTSFLGSMIAYVARCFCIAADQYGDREDQHRDGLYEDESPLAAESDAPATQRLRDAPATRPPGILILSTFDGIADGTFKLRRTRCSEATRRRSIGAMNTQLLENDDDVPPLVPLWSQSESDDEHDFASRGHVSHAELP